MEGLEFVGNVACSNTVSDGQLEISYAGMKDVFRKLDAFFATYKITEINCLHVSFRNAVPDVLLCLYLMQNEINFFLSSANTTGQGIPPFCDKSVIIETGSSENICSLILEDNPGSKEGSAIPKQGAVIFSSSGSTGPPKFVVFRSDKLVLNARNCIQRFGFGSHTKVLVPVPINHMYGFGVGLLPSIIAGASIWLVEKNNVLRLFDALREFKPNITLLTPAVCRMILVLNKKLPGKSLFISAGERIKKESYCSFESKYGSLVNLYGCTEMGAMATSPVNDFLDERTDGVVEPLENILLKIGGIKGEMLCKQSAGFEHYIDANGDKLNTHSVRAGWYKTRDMGMSVEKNKFTVLGRIDNCINRLGFLVSLQEIESILEDMFPEIQQSVIVEGRDERIAGTSLVAICVLKKNKILDNEKARSLCRNRMPGHYVPDNFVFVKEIPGLPNGKPDRSYLANNYSLLFNQ